VVLERSVRRDGRGGEPGDGGETKDELHVDGQCRVDGAKVDGRTGGGGALARRGPRRGREGSRRKRLALCCPGLDVEEWAKKMGKVVVNGRIRSYVPCEANKVDWSFRGSMGESCLARNGLASNKGGSRKS
jgi:hypothetical protein